MNLKKKKQEINRKETEWMTEIEKEIKRKDKKNCNKAGKKNEIFRRLIDYNNESDEKKNLYCCLPCSSHTK